MSWLLEVERKLAARPVLRVAEIEGLRRSAVLVPLQVVAGELWAVLTRRAENLPRHAGQVAFPGGAADSEDADEVATALREAREELGIDPASVIVLGHLNDQVTSTSFLVSPVVGALPATAELAPASGEVSAVLTVPLGVLARPDLIEEVVVGRGRARRVSPVLHCRGHRIAGATARIVSDLVERLTGAPPCVP